MKRLMAKGRDGFPSRLFGGKILSHWKRGVFMELLAKETQNPRAAWYFQTLEK